MLVFKQLLTFFKARCFIVAVIIAAIILCDSHFVNYLKETIVFQASVTRIIFKNFPFLKKVAQKLSLEVKNTFDNLKIHFFEDYFHLFKKL